MNQEEKETLNSLVPIEEEKDHHKARILPLSTKIFELAEKKKVFSKCWLTFLKLPLTTDTYKRILVNLHEFIMPHMNHPIMLMDFLTDSYNLGNYIRISKRRREN